MKDDINSAKRDLRTQMRRTLEGMPARERAIASARVCDLLHDEAKGGVLVYLGDVREVDLDPLISEWINAGVRVAAPRCDWDAGTLDAVRLASLDDVEVRRHGVREAAGGDIIAPDDLGLVLVPGVAFDPDGGRLGRGGGFYDRFLAGAPKSVRRVGVCFEAQVVDHVPREAHDALVEGVVTESGWIFPDQPSG